MPYTFEFIPAPPAGIDVLRRFQLSQLINEYKSYFSDTNKLVLVWCESKIKLA